MIGTTVGHFRVLSVIGSGGMGEVYTAFDEVLERKVALKAIRAERRLDPQSKGRFRREARALSQLAHPNICQIYDFIESEDADFLVLELITGRSLTRDLAQSLDARTKLRYASEIADVLIATHAKGIVHRDLKPDNVMVTAEGQIKVLDFGLSRGAADESAIDEAPSSGSAELDGEGDDHTAVRPASFGSASTEQLTTAGTIMGTLGYMSPEQARGEAATPASDMFSFGLVLQELFSGKPSFDRAGTVHERLERAKRGETCAFHDDDADLTALVARMKSLSADARPTAAEVRDRLRWIAMKPARRRKRFAAVAAFTVLTLFSIGATAEAIVIAKERNRANQEATRARSTLSFLAGTFDIANPWRGTGPSTTAVAIIDHGVANLKTTESDPLLNAALRMQLADIYLSMGVAESAEPLARKALEIRERAAGADPASVAQSVALIGAILRSRGKFDEAAATLTRAIKMYEKASGPDSEEVADAVIGLAHAQYYAHKYAAARAAAERARRIYEKHLPESESSLADALMSIATTFVDERKPAQAEPLILRSIGIKQKVFGPNHVEVAAALSNLANLYTHMGKSAQAEPIARRVLGIDEQTFGANHLEVTRARGIVAMICVDLAKYDEGERLFRLNHDAYQRIYGPDHPRTYQPLYNIACAEALRGRKDEALRYLHVVVDHAPRALYLRELNNDADLASLHGEPDFQALVSRVSDVAKHTAVR